jgi:hypothetical protein
MAIANSINRRRDRRRCASEHISGAWTHARGEPLRRGAKARAPGAFYEAWLFGGAGGWLTNTEMANDTSTITPKMVDAFMRSTSTGTPARMQKKQ